MWVRTGRVPTLTTCTAGCPVSIFFLTEEKNFLVNKRHVLKWLWRFTYVRDFRGHWEVIYFLRCNTVLWLWRRMSSLHTRSTEIRWVRLLVSPRAYFLLPASLPAFLPPTLLPSLFTPHWRTFLHCFLENKGERETRMREKHQSFIYPACWARDWTHNLGTQGLNPQPRYVPWPVIKPATFWLQDDAPTKRATPARAHSLFSYGLIKNEYRKYKAHLTKH